MARFPSGSLTLTLPRAYDLYFRLFWILLTYVACAVIWPAFWEAYRLTLRDDITDLERLIYDTTRLWYATQMWLCILLSVGCVVGFLPNSKFRARCIEMIIYQMFFLFIRDAFSCYLTYNILQSRGFDIIGKACQVNKPTHLSEILFFEEFCRDVEFVSKYVALAALVVWKLVGLNMIVLTWIWYKCAAKGQEAIEKEVPEGAGLVELTETLNVELKV